jgi:hypothetical protein
MMVDDSTRKHQEGLERLRQAREFAEWSRRDREARLPPLTVEQAEQMRHYLQIVEQHGFSKSLELAAAANGGKQSMDDCVGCPVAGLVNTATMSAATSNATRATSTRQ